MRLLAVWMASVALLVGCTPNPPCNRERIGQAALILEQDRTIDGRRRGLTELDGACVGLPKDSLGDFLFSEYTGDLPEESTFLGPDVFPVWNQACEPTLSESAYNELWIRHGRDLGRYEWCNFARLGLIDRDRYSDEDLQVFGLHWWLTHNGVDDALAKRVVRALAFAYATREELESYCMGAAVGCGSLRKQVDVALPSIEIPHPLRPAVVLTVTKTALTVGDDALISLERGLARSGDVDRRVLPPLEARLTELRGGDLPRRVLVLADASTPVETLLRILYTSARAGYYELQIGAGERWVGTKTVVAPPAWLPPDRRSGVTGYLEATPGRLARVGAGAISTEDPQALRRWVADHTGPHHNGESRFVLRVDPSLTVQSLVDIIDGLHGGADGCRSPETYCPFNVLSIDALPGWIPREDRWQTLRFTVDFLDSSMEQVEPPPIVRKAVEADLVAYSACVTQQPERRGLIEDGDIFLYPDVYWFGDDRVDTWRSDPFKPCELLRATNGGGPPLDVKGPREWDVLLTAHFVDAPEPDRRNSR